MPPFRLRSSSAAEGPNAKLTLFDGFDGAFIPPPELEGHGCFILDRLVEEDRFVETDDVSHPPLAYRATKEHTKQRCCRCCLDRNWPDV